MSTELLAALLTFALVSTLTPGPNNLMVMASGANFGYLRSLRHILGIALGFAFMIAVVGMGLVRVFDLYPGTYTALKYASVAYLAWLAWKIAHAAAPQDGQATGRPLTFVQAAAFQWVNPKAWAMALTAIGAYAPARDLSSVALVAGVFALITLPSTAVWALMGRQIRRILTRPARLTAFNWIMAALLLASLYPALTANG